MSDRAARPYHHGDLRAALLSHAEAILERDGIQALTLRAAARAAGVSHAAPTNHFGDLTGLLSELAAVGYRRFAAQLSAAMAAAGPDPTARLRAQGRAYVDFARTHPGMFVLMFRSERLDAERPALRDAIATARNVLRSGIADRASGPPPSPMRAAAMGTALWSLVHGFAMLLVDGRLQPILDRLPGAPDADALLDAVFDVTKVEL